MSVHKERGFAAIWIVIIFLAVAGIGVGGYVTVQKLKTPALSPSLEKVIPPQVPESGASKEASSPPPQPISAPQQTPVVVPPPAIPVSPPVVFKPNPSVPSNLSSLEKELQGVWKLSRYYEGDTERPPHENQYLGFWGRHLCTSSFGTYYADPRIPDEQETPIAACFVSSELFGQTEGWLPYTLSGNSIRFESQGPGDSASYVNGTIEFLHINKGSTKSIYIKTSIPVRSL